jgi:hypothetical protein
MANGHRAARRSKPNGVSSIIWRQLKAASIMAAKSYQQQPAVSAAWLMANVYQRRNQLASVMAKRNGGWRIS